MDISVILPVANEAENLRTLLPRLTALLDREHITHEIVVIDGNSTDGTRETAAALGARVVMERRRGYAGAMETGIAEARGDYLLTLDADQSHDPDFVTEDVAGAHPRRHRRRIALRAGRGCVLRLHPPLDQLVSELDAAAVSLDAGVGHLQWISIVPA